MTSLKDFDPKNPAHIRELAQSIATTPISKGVDVPIDAYKSGPDSTPGQAAAERAAEQRRQQEEAAHAKRTGRTQKDELRDRLKITHSGSGSRSIG